jgi:hypothetical protein
MEAVKLMRYQSVFVQRLLIGCILGASNLRTQEPLVKQAIAHKEGDCGRRGLASTRNFTVGGSDVLNGKDGGLPRLAAFQRIPNSINKP